MQEIYKKPIKHELIIKIINKIKSSGVLTAVTVTPQRAEELGPVAQNAGADLLIIQSTVIATNFVTNEKNKKL